MKDYSEIEIQCVGARRRVSWKDVVRLASDYLRKMFSLDRQRGRARAAWAARAGRLCRLEVLEPRWALSVGDPYNAPASPGAAINEDPGWKFQLNPSGSPQVVGYNDSAWSNVNLPYTWNGSSSSTGVGWYRKTITVDPSLIGNELYLNFEAGYLATSLYIDGVQVDYNPAVAGNDPHLGGFAGFTFDVTSQLTAGNHLIAVQVNSNNNTNVSPAGSGDYTHQGGLYRDVTLLAVSKTHVALIENATDVPPATTPASIATNTPISTPGVYFTTTSNVTIGTASADVQIKTVLDNQSLSAASVNVVSYLVDASGIIQCNRLQLRLCPPRRLRSRSRKLPRLPTRTCGTAASTLTCTICTSRSATARQINCSTSITSRSEFVHSKSTRSPILLTPILRTTQPSC